MSQGLSVSRLISVALILTPLPAQFQNFDSCMIVGESDVINVQDRYRSYNDLPSVAADFGTTAPEYLAATLFFSQVPQPVQLYIGRWAHGATHGLLLGGGLTSSQQAIGLWTAVTNGGFKIAVDGGAVTAVGGLDFHLQSNLNGVAGIIQTAVQALGGAFAAVTVTWNGSQFVFRSGTTGAASAVAALVAPTAGGVIDISAQLKATTATLSEIVAGIAAESALAAIQALDALNVQWYALAFAAPDLVDGDVLAIAAYVEAASTGNPHIFGVTSSAAAAITQNDSTSIGFQLKALGYRRTFVQWSSTQPYAAASLLGRGCVVDFNGNLTVITFMWKQEPGIIAESLTASQANALDSTNQNYFANYNNGTAIVVNGKVANGDFIDNTWDLDWLVNQIQTNVYNVLYTSATKVPQTNSGNNQIKTAITAALLAGVNNGTIAPGTWNSQGFGQLAQGDFLPRGFYVYQPDISTQAESDRAARKSVPFQVAVKLAGAIHTVAISVTVNR